jgi:hypothetical protein
LATTPMITRAMKSRVTSREDTWSV